MEPVDIRSRHPAKTNQSPLEWDEVNAQRHALVASRLDAQFIETRHRIQLDLARLEPALVVPALSPQSRRDAREADYRSAGVVRTI